jgi:hypothetical protein
MDIGLIKHLSKWLFCRAFQHRYLDTIKVSPLLDSFDLDEIWHPGPLLGPTQYFMDIGLIGCAGG